MPKISVLLTDDENARLARYCRETGYKKSSLAARLIREHLNREGFQVQSELFSASPERKRRAPTKRNAKKS